MSVAACGTLWPLMPFLYRLAQRLITRSGDPGPGGSLAQRRRNWQAGQESGTKSESRLIDGSASQSSCEPLTNIRIRIPVSVASGGCRTCCSPLGLLTPTPKTDATMKLRSTSRSAVRGVEGHDGDGELTARLGLGQAGRTGAAERKTR
ncbi:hypothetical protein IWX47DRAFT_518688 [Phyllosticta citricarpa]